MVNPPEQPSGPIQRPGSSCLNGSLPYVGAGLGPAQSGATRPSLPVWMRVSLT